MIIIPIGLGNATSADFEVDPRTKALVALIDTDGGSIDHNSQAVIQWKDSNGMYYPVVTLSGGREDARTALLEPGNYRVVRRDGRYPIGVELVPGTDLLGPTLPPTAPADTTAAAMYAWNGTAYERVTSTQGRQNVTIDGERFATSVTLSLTVAGTLVQLASTAASYLEFSNTSGKVVGYTRNNLAPERLVQPYESVRIVLPSGNANEIRVRNATDTESITVTFDALRRAIT